MAIIIVLAIVVGVILLTRKRYPKLCPVCQCEDIEVRHDYRKVCCKTCGFVLEKW